MTLYRLKIEEVLDGRAVTSYTRWVDAVQMRGAQEQKVYVTFSPRFERLWLECKKRLLDDLAQRPAAIRLRSPYAIRLYAWAKDHLSAGTRRVTLEELRTVLGLDSAGDADGNVIPEARLAAWANFRQRTLNLAIAEINAKTDLNIAQVAGERRAWAGNDVHAIRTYGRPPVQSTVYGLNGDRLYYIISLFKVTYKSTIQVSRNFHALFTKTLENSDTCD